MIHEMRVRTLVGVVALAGVVAGSASACSPAAFDTPVEGTLSAEGGTAAACDTSTPKKLDAIDIAGLAACCAPGATGAAHCVPEAKVPAGYRKATAPCTGGYCIPDALIKTGGAKPPSCKTSLGDGACISVCIPSVAAKKELLEQGSCAGADVFPATARIGKKPTYG